LASSGGNDTDRLSRCAITKIVAQAVGQRSGRTTSVRAARQTPGRAASDLAKSLQLVPFRPHSCVNGEGDAWNDGWS
jgi:hypothetical protein